MSKGVLINYLTKFKPLVDVGIEEELKKRINEVGGVSSELVKIIAAMQELSVGGKRLRALLVILGYQIATGNEVVPQSVIKAGVVMELFHLGLLIQDDIMDQDSRRRGVTTIHARYDDKHTGESVAMCAGDFTYGWGIEIMSKLDLPKERLLSAMSVWGKYFYRVGYGQVLDVMKIANEETLLQILALKSGEYSCVLPLTLGATLGGGKPELIRKLEEYGMELGWVFQLRDDWLGEYGDPAKTGKPVGNDSREGKKTLATMYGKEKLEVETKRHIETAKNCISGIKEHADLLDELVIWIGTRDH